jgi:hypothetical protein
MVQPFSDRAIQIIAEDKIRSAIKAGEFDHLPGFGKPLRVVEEPYDENWWLRRKLQAERLDSFASELRSIALET